MYYYTKPNPELLVSTAQDVYQRLSPCGLTLIDLPICLLKVLILFIIIHKCSKNKLMVKFYFVFITLYALLILPIET